jgi:protein-tyrosine-phosphatase
MAEALLRHALDAEAEPLRSMPIISTGLAACIGEPASPNSVRALKNVGIDLVSHRSRALTQELLNNSVAVFGMTGQHLRSIRARFNPVPEHLYLMRGLMPEGVSREIPDPYGMGLTEYEACRDSMVEAIPSLVAFLRKVTGMA